MHDAAWAWLVPGYLSTWLITYGLHSGLACALALALTKRLTDPRQRDFIWKGALVAPPVTAGLAVLSAWVIGVGSRLDSGRLFRHAFPQWRFEIKVTQFVLRDTGAEPVVRTQVDDAFANSASAIVIAVALSLVAVALVRKWRRDGAFRRAIAGRLAVEPSAVARLRDAGARAVRLSQSRGIATPVALSGSEVCLPTDSFWQLSSRQRESVMAHELAHLERRDPEWITLCEWIAVFSAFQPLCRPVLRSLRRDAEFICDERAARRLGDSRPLVESLAAFASLFDGDHPWVQTVGYDGSPVVERSARLLSFDPRRAEAGGSWWRPAAIAVAGLALVAAVPSVATLPLGMTARELRTELTRPDALAPDLRITGP